MQRSATLLWRGASETAHAGHAHLSGPKSVPQEGILLTRFCSAESAVPMQGHNLAMDGSQDPERTTRRILSNAVLFS